jgi:hypothetical protein
VLLSLITLAIPSYALLQTVLVAAQVQGADKTTLAALTASLVITMIVLVLNIISQFRLRAALKDQRPAVTNGVVDLSTEGG